MSKPPQLLSIPNLLSLLRIVLVPLFVTAAWSGNRSLFLTLFLAALLSDALDGYLARRLGQTSELGSRLDSWGDCLVYCATPLALWWLWPGLLRREAPFFLAAGLAFAVPIAIGFLKYQKLTSYHTRGAKLAAVLLAAATPLLLLGGPAWPFRLAVGVLVLAECEEIAITLTLPAWHSNVPTLAAARRLRKNHRSEQRENI